MYILVNYSNSNSVGTPVKGTITRASEKAQKNMLEEGRCASSVSNMDTLNLIFTIYL
jgi:hypothetical protein